MLGYKQSHIAALYDGTHFKCRCFVLCRPNDEHLRWPCGESATVGGFIQQELEPSLVCVRSNCRGVGFRIDVKALCRSVLHRIDMYGMQSRVGWLKCHGGCACFAVVDRVDLSSEVTLLGFLVWIYSLV